MIGSAMRNRHGKLFFPAKNMETVQSPSKSLDLAEFITYIHGLRSDRFRSCPCPNKNLLPTTIGLEG